MYKHEKEKKITELAKEIIQLSRNTLLVNFRFFEVALNKLTLIFDSKYPFEYCTDGAVLYINSFAAINAFKCNKNRPVRSYLHVLLHCVFQHMFIGEGINTNLWDISCDIAVEYSLSQLKSNVLQDPSIGNYQDTVFENLKSKIGIITAEKIYEYYKNEEIDDSLLYNLRTCFFVDDHSLWYRNADGNNICELSINTSGDGKENFKHLNNEPLNISEELKEEWRDIAEHIQKDLETFSKKRGDSAGGLIQNLLSVNREKYDYTEFLKKFASLGEAMIINDDEFDYIYYTYGLTLYKKMPLIEPLEYQEVKRVKEFVIAIDTSGSVQGEVVQTFLEKTYNILKTEESFFKKINVHIIQCDAEIQEDFKIQSSNDFENYIRTMRIRGLGGTDFRPVFAYVDELINRGEFINLKGLIYFTDGYGVFPKRKPEYKTAFVFLDKAYNNYDVPSWAIKMILQAKEII